MSKEVKCWYVVKEIPMTLLDVIPGYSNTYDNNIRTRTAYAMLWNTDVRNITLMSDKNRAKHYLGWIPV